MDYCKGNVAILQEFSFTSILEIIEFQQEKENTAILLQVYQASFAALRGVEFEEFKSAALAEAKPNNGAAVAPRKPTEEVEKNVAAILDNNKWEVKKNGG